MPSQVMFFCTSSNTVSWFIMYNLCTSGFFPVTISLSAAGMWSVDGGGTGICAGDGDRDRGWVGNY